MEHDEWFNKASGHTLLIWRPHATKCCALEGVEFECYKWILTLLMKMRQKPGTIPDGACSRFSKKDYKTLIK